MFFRPCKSDRRYRGKRYNCMNTILTIFTYTISWFLVLSMILSVIGNYLQYRGLEHKSTKARTGLITIVLLWLAATIGLAVAQIHSIDLARKEVPLLLLFDSFLMQSISQWTIASMQKPIQRVLRWIMTSLVLALGLVIVGFFVFVRV